MAIHTRDRVIAGLIGTALLGASAFLASGCSEHPDTVASQFYTRLATLDIGGMSQLVCQNERAAFRESVAFLESVPGAQPPDLEDFEARTETSDGTAVVMRVSGRFVDAELGEMAVSARVRLVREGGEWCISGEGDGFRAVRGSAADMFALLIRGGISGEFGAGAAYDGVSSSTREVVVNTPPPGGPPVVDGEIVMTASGLQYVDIEAGSGPQPEAGQMVVVHYRLWLEASGALIDSSLDGEPFSFRLGDGSVVAGFEEGISTMHVGGQRRLIILPKLGYGDDDDYGDIPPNSTLVFDVELVEVR